MHNMPRPSHSVLRPLLGPLLLVFLVGCASQPDRPTDPEAALNTHIQLALGYIENGNRESARHHLRRATELDRRSPRVAGAMAMLYQLEGENELAEEQFRLALRRDRNFTQARNNYGAFLFGQGRYEEAYRQFDTASRDLDYTHRAHVLLSLGRTALELDRPERAEAAFSHAYTLNRRLTPVLIELADLNFQKGDYAEAKRYLDLHAAATQATPRSLLLGIKIERIFRNTDREASYAMALRNLYPYSREYLEYQRLLDEDREANER